MNVKSIVVALVAATSMLACATGAPDEKGEGDAVQVDVGEKLGEGSGTAVEPQAIRAGGNGTCQRFSDGEVICCWLGSDGFMHCASY